MIVSIYTDASTLSDREGRSGIGVVVTFHGDIYKTVGLYLGKMDSIAAELLGIMQALVEASDIAEHAEVSLVRIICDCEPAIDLVLGETETEREDLFELVEQIDAICQEFTCPVDFQWVKAHNGNKYNELADSIAYDHAHN